MIRCLTLAQPWATLVALGEKRIETRSWYTPHRGELAIHAAKGFPAWARELAESDPMFVTCLDAHGVDWLPLGAVVALCRLDAVLRTDVAGGDLVTAKERAFGDFSPGRFAWFLSDVRALPVPIPARGNQGLWNWQPPDSREAARCSS